VADPRRSRLRLVAFLVALVLALGAVAFLVVSLRERDDARADLAASQAALRAARATSSTAATDLAAARRTLAQLRQQLTVVGPAAAALGTLDEQDLASVRAALEAGLAGNLDAYNQAVDQRSAIDPQHDAALEQLRQQVNAIITALDEIRG
jgi:Tfp pilus assembly protein PilV